MLAFLTRRNDNTAASATADPTSAEQSNVLMRFLTHGGAEVHITSPGNQIRCHGCDYARGWTSVIYARGDANEHADKCRAMPKPTA